MNDDAKQALNYITRTLMVAKVTVRLPRFVRIVNLSLMIPNERGN